VKPWRHRERRRRPPTTCVEMISSSAFQFSFYILLSSNSKGYKLTCRRNVGSYSAQMKNLDFAADWRLVVALAWNSTKFFYIRARDDVKRLVHGIVFVLRKQ
jgi:hypothetical protein